MTAGSHPARSPEFLSRLHDGELSPAERAHFESHRAHCAECRGAARGRHVTLPHGRALLGRGDHRPARYAPDLVRLVRPRVAVPIHWGTLHPIGLRRMRPRTRIDPPHEFARLAADIAPDTLVRVVPVGGSLDLDGDLTDD